MKKKLQTQMKKPENKEAKKNKENKQRKTEKKNGMTLFY